MHENELDINYLVSCIESINQINTIPSAEGLKQVINDWVDNKTIEALADPTARVQIFYNWKRLTGDADSEKMVDLIDMLPDTELANEVRQFFQDRVSNHLEGALNDSANKMLFFRSWLANKSAHPVVPSFGTNDQTTIEGENISTPTPDVKDPNRPW
jgi:hypothetical protein